MLANHNTADVNTESFWPLCYSNISSAESCYATEERISLKPNPWNTALTVHYNMSTEVVLHNARLFE